MLGIVTITSITLLNRKDQEGEVTIPVFLSDNKVAKNIYKNENDALQEI